MTYVDGFVTPVPNANREAFAQHARGLAALFREHGALSVVDCWGDDVPEGTLTSFTMAVQRRADESVVFSWVTWPSREARDAGWEKLMADPRMHSGNNPMPFDGKRMIYGGFEMLG
ncbi:MAG: RNA signal recognition particle 4.5S RNA [Methylibium sp. NZG]|nr:MAG: RNA signal recognition particle 4.5S RNA [Methylibium sp. NZG]